MTEMASIALVAVIGLVIVCLAQFVHHIQLLKKANASRELWIREADTRLQLRLQESEALLRKQMVSERIADRASQQVLDKLLIDPKWAAQLHAQERIEGERLATSLRREEIRQQKPPPPPAEYFDPDGVPTDNVEEARV